MHEPSDELYPDWYAQASAPPVIGSRAWEHSNYCAWHDGIPCTCKDPSEATERDLTRTEELDDE